MKVKELIKQLSELDQEKEVVYLGHSPGIYGDVCGVYDGSVYEEAEAVGTVVLEIDN